MFFKCNYKPLFDVLLEFFKYESVYRQESNDLDKAIQTLYGSFRVYKFLRILKNSYPNYYRLVKLYDEDYYKYKRELSNLKCRYLYTKEPAYEFIREIYDEFKKTKPPVSRFKKGDCTRDEIVERQKLTEYLNGLDLGKQLGDNYRYTFLNNHFRSDNTLDDINLERKEKAKKKLIERLKELY